MRYVLASFLYWPIWIAFKINGYSYWGMLIGALFVFAAFSLMWKLEFGTWNFWGDEE